MEWGWTRRCQYNIRGHHPPPQLPTFKCSIGKSATSKNVWKLEVVYMVTTDLMVLLKSSFSDKTTSEA